MIVPAWLDRFKKTKPQPLSISDQAVSESSVIYSTGSFTKYNPDDLIGRQGFGIYKKMTRDEQIKAVVKFKRDAITSRDYYFELDHEKYGISEEEAQRRIHISEEYIEQMRGSWMDVLNGIMTAIQYGFSMSEKIHTQIEVNNLTYWGIDRIKLRPFDTFKFDPDKFGNVENVYQEIGTSKNPIKLKDFIHFVVNPDVDEHYGQSELRECHRSWFSKDTIIKFRNIWLERHAGGFIVITPEGDREIIIGSQEYIELTNLLNNLRTSAGIILPSGLKIEQFHPSNNVAFKEAIEDYDMSMARALLVPNLLGVSPQGKHGSLSQADDQLEAFMWTLEADNQRLIDTLNEQLFRSLGEVNFGDNAWPRYRTKPISGKRKMEVINVWKELVTSGAVKHSDADEAHLRELMEFPERTEDVDPLEPQDDDSDIGGDDDPLPDETIIGKSLISVSATMSRAERRVDFAVIGRTSESITDDYTKSSGEAMDVIIADLIDKAKQGGELSEDVTDNIKALKVDTKLKQKLNRVQTAMVKEGWQTGIKHASLEIDKAKQSSFSRRIDKERLEFIAADYFKMKAFKITGNLTDEAVKIIEMEILNGAKYGKAWSEVEKSIYTTFATRGMITNDQAKEALGEALNVNNPDARLRTIVRTNTFDAINEARHSYFTDPQLGDFVQAYQYSAILDSRTTTICRHLDDEHRGDHSIEWYQENAQYKPPNHYNCRSLLIPVTKNDMDSFTEGDAPTMEPQDGFR